jgi:hypothetical protein
METDGCLVTLSHNEDDPLQNNESTVDDECSRRAKPSDCYENMSKGTKFQDYCPGVSLTRSGDSTLVSKNYFSKELQKLIW